MRVIGLLRSRHARIWVAIAVCGAASGLLRAQTTFATLQGTIHDPSGAVIANAAVAVKNVETGASRSTLSNGAGIYSFPDLQPSIYELMVSAAGFANQRRANVGLTVDAEETLNIALSPSAINSEVDE